MQSLQMLTGPTGPSPAARTFTDSTPKQTPAAERFDTLIGKALSHSSSGRGNDADSGDAAIQDRARSKQTPRPRPTDSASPDHAYDSVRYIMTQVN